MKISEKQIREFNFVERNRLKVERTFRPKAATATPTQKKKTVRALSPAQIAKRQLDKQIDSLLGRIAEAFGEGHTVYLDKLSSFSFALASIRVIKGERDAKNKNKEALVTTIAIYPAIGDRMKIGSIAVYGADLLTTKIAIDRSGSYFGLPATRTQFLKGLNCYLDITIQAA